MLSFMLGGPMLLELLTASLKGKKLAKFVSLLRG